MSKAPENMPTETIQRYIDEAMGQLSSWEAVEETALHKLRTAIKQQYNYELKVAEYRGWLWDRENADD